MLYLLDANVLIRAHEDYYPIDRIPQFWDWLANEADSGHAKMPLEIHDEIASASGPLKDWVTDTHVRSAIVLSEEVDRDLLNHVIDRAYAPDLNEDELDEAGRDPFLVTYALMGHDRTVVTKEVSRTSQIRGRRKVPDACTIMGVPWLTDFRFYQQRNFRIP